MSPGFESFRKACFPLVALALMAVPSAWGAEPCAQCHAAEVAGFKATPMGQSMGPPDPKPAATFVHALSNTKFYIKPTKTGMVQGLKRNGFSAHYQMAYAIGSGSHAMGYLIQIGDHLFQSPLTYYPGYGWGMAPGMENNEAPDFDMPISDQCLFCHAGEVRPVRGTSYTYQEPVFAAEQITCARCHGPVEAHLRNPVPGSIINPAKLPVQARDSVCEECHLAGEAYILNPGKQFEDFRPGENLEDVFTVYVFSSSRDPAHPNAPTVVSQTQQLALSTCARMSGGKLWCGTCHDPHALPADPMAYFRSRCLSCHGDALLTTHPKPNDNCVGCHMPHIPVSNGGHTIFTEHRIAIYSAEEIAGKAAAANPPGGKGDLVAWRQPAVALVDRNQGLADIFTGERTQSFPLVSQGYNLLVQAWSKFANDPAVVTAMGVVRLGTGDASGAEALFEKVIQMTPNDAPSYVHAALAWHMLHNNDKAIQCLNKALQLDPLEQQPYRNLAAIYGEENDPDKVRQTYERFLKAFPQSLEAQSDVEKTELITPLPAMSGNGPTAH